MWDLLACHGSTSGNTYQLGSIEPSFELYQLAYVPSTAPSVGPKGITRPLPACILAFPALISLVSKVMMPIEQPDFVPAHSGHECSANHRPDHSRTVTHGGMQESLFFVRRERAACVVYGQCPDDGYPADSWQCKSQCQSLDLASIFELFRPSKLLLYRLYPDARRASQCSFYHKK